MKEIGLSLAGLGLLYLTRRKMTADLARLVGRFGGGQRMFVWLWSVIFLPGTIIHEMSHLFAAAVTGTKIGRVEIFPELPRGGIGVDDRLPRPRPEVGARNDKNTFHLGYVQTQELGLIRGFLVGTAPLFIGLGLLVWISSALEFSDFRFQISDLLKLYLFFTVANSLFPSWVDIKHALPLIILGAIAGISLYFSGVNMALTSDSPVLTAISSLSKALTLSVVINFLILLIVWLMNVIFSVNLKRNSAI